MRIGIKSLHDFLSLVIRRKWWVIAPFVALSCIVAILTKQLPRVYVSESLVLVRPRDVSQQFVMDLNSVSAEQRLRSIEQTVRSRKNIVAVLNEFKDRLPEFQSLNIDDAVEKFDKQIDIKFNAMSDSRGGVNITSFRIRYSHRDPVVAKDIDSKLTQLFIDQDSRTRETSVFGTNQFLSDELEKRKVELDASEDKMRALKTSNQPTLPSQLEPNLRALDRLGEQRKGNSDAIQHLQTSRLNLEQVMAQTAQFLPDNTATPFTALPKENPLVEEFRKAKLEFEQTVRRFPPGSQIPDIGIANARMEALKQQLTPEELEAALRPPSPPEVEKPEDKRTPNPAYTTLTNSMRSIETELEIRQKEKADIEGNLKKIEARVAATPGVDQSLSEILRENADIRKEYDDINASLFKAQLSESLDSKQKGGQFEVLDPANVPVKPEKPNKWGILFAGILLSLALSIGVALLSDIARQRVWTQSEVEAFWGVPVMVDIPSIVTEADVALAQRKRWIVAASSLAATVLFGICMYVLYLNTASILERLDPVLQKVVYR